MIETIKQLRERTGSGYEQCKKALNICNNDSELAFYYLRYMDCVPYLKGKLTHEEWALMKAKKDLKGLVTEME